MTENMLCLQCVFCGSTSRIADYEIKNFRQTFAAAVAGSWRSLRLNTALCKPDESDDAVIQTKVDGFYDVYITEV